MICDPKSLLYIYGMQLDFSTALIGGGFLVSPSLEFTSRDTVFLYPDCRTGRAALENQDSTLYHN